MDTQPMQSESVTVYCRLFGDQRCHIQRNMDRAEMLRGEQPGGSVRTAEQAGAANRRKRGPLSPLSDLCVRPRKKMK